MISGFYDRQVIRRIRRVNLVVSGLGIGLLVSYGRLLLGGGNGLPRLAVGRSLIDQK